MEFGNKKKKIDKQNKEGRDDLKEFLCQGMAWTKTIETPNSRLNPSKISVNTCFILTSPAGVGFCKV